MIYNLFLQKPKTYLQRIGKGDVSSRSYGLLSRHGISRQLMSLFEEITVEHAQNWRSKYNHRMSDTNCDGGKNIFMDKSVYHIHTTRLPIQL